MKMKYIKQFLIIIAVSFAGELLKMLIPLPVPASIYGLLLMLAGLLTGIIPLSSVKETGDFLIEIMPLMFIAPAVGLLETWGILKPILWQVAVILVLTTFFVMIVSGAVTQLVIRRERRKKNEGNNQ
jgi:holin-like protein